MNQRVKLREFFFDEKDQSDYIQKYEENIHYFNTLINTGGTEDLEFALTIKIYIYACALKNKNDYQKAYNVFCECEKELERIKGSSVWYSKFREASIVSKEFCKRKLANQN